MKDSVFVSLLFTTQALLRRLEEDSGMSHARIRILAALRQGESRNQNQIATELRMDRAMVHRIVKALVGEGALRETKAPTGPSYHLQLTAAGEALHDRAIASRKAIDGVINGVVGKQSERAELIRKLDALRQALEEEEG